MSREVDLEAELFELDGEVNGIQGDVGGDGDAGGGEVEDSLDPGGDELVDDFLRDVGGDGDDGQADLTFLDGRFELGQGLDGKGVEFLADEIGVVVEGVG